MEFWQLKQRQSLPFEAKEYHSLLVLEQFINKFNGMVFVSFSGGLQSTITLDLARRIDPTIPGVMAGKEDPRNIEFSKTLDNIVFLKSLKQQKLIFKEDGYPLINKDVARYIHDIRHPSKRNMKTVSLRLTGITSKGNKSSKCLPKKYYYLLDAPFEISDNCCYYQKEKPLDNYAKETGRARIDGTMASESRRRSLAYLKTGCNNYNAKIPTSKPLSIWYLNDCWCYQKKRQLSYSRAYDEGEIRTGCVFCLFGIHNEPEPNRIQRLKIWNPRLYEYGMDELEIYKVLDYIKVKY